MQKFNQLFLTVFLSFIFISFGYAAHSNLTASMSGFQEVPPVTTAASGTAAITITNTGGITYVVTVNGLSGPITGAHFHFGQSGTSGPVVFDIGPTFTGNNASGVWSNPPDSILAAFLTGRMYVNVHTAANPAGEIRGQVLLSAGTYLRADLEGLQEVPPVTTGAKGTASIVLTSVNSLGLAFFISANGLSGPITGAHFHYARAGVSGPVVFNITGNFGSGTSALGVWRNSPSSPIPDSLIVALLTGNLYVNIHTAANPAGEIRGQVVLSGGYGFDANLDGSQEVPPVNTQAKGTASITLTDYGLVYELTVQGLSGAITGAHFHNAPFGVSGPVVKGITGTFAGSTARGIWRSNPSDPTEPMTNQLLRELLAGNIYLNVHTAANPAGEIRGQVTLKTNSGAGASLDTAQETSNVNAPSNPKGSASLTITPTGVSYNITVNGLTGAITGAHFHYGFMGEPGPVVKTITSSFTGNTATGTWGVGDPEPFNDSLRAALVAGRLYLNVHTSANPAGEIRGQVLLNAGVGFTSNLTGPNEVPPVPTVASGTVSYTLTRDGLAFSASVEGLSGPITGAHFHYGLQGVAGPVVRNLTPNVNGNNIRGYWRTTDAQPLNDSLFTALMTGRIYINVHTAVNPAGEIRGQVILNEGTGLTAQLDGSQEVPPVTTSARGTGSVTINDAGVRYVATITGLSSAITGSHFHNAPFGTNGPVVRTLTFADNSTSGVWRPSDSEALTNALMRETYAGNIYMNVHTSSNPAGEIRGQLKTDGIIIIGIEPISGEVPALFSLGQNYPNPFNAVSKFKIQIAKTGSVKLLLYNILGEEVANLFEGELNPGTFEIQFDGTDYASGVYFYRLITPFFSDTKTMVLLK